MNMYVNIYIRKYFYTSLMYLCLSDLCKQICYVSPVLFAPVIIKRVKFRKMEIFKNKKSFLLHANGYLFYKNGGEIGVNQTTYWRCKKCSARATTRGDVNNFELVKIANDGDHGHASNSGVYNI